MRIRGGKPSRWLDIVLLPTAAVLLLPIVLVALAPVLLTFIVLWPLLILPILAVPQALPVGEARRVAKRRVAPVVPVRDLPQAA